MDRPGLSASPGRRVAIVQARTGSTRLPGKVLLPLLGAPILQRVVERTARAVTVDEVVVATTTSPADDTIVTLARDHGWRIHRGSADDLLDRYVGAARANDADVVIRITSDCPLVDPEVIDETVAAFSDGSVDYASTGLEPRTWPRGLDVEVVASDALERAWREDANPAWREHATPYLYRNPDRFRILRVPAPEDLSDHRWCVDTPEDYELVRRIYEAAGRPDAGWRDTLAIVRANPSWSDLNRHVPQKVVPA
jgi:spore coat polysaccharide biosynthesis protein SpsF